MIPMKIDHHINRLRNPRFRSRSDSGSAATFHDQMMPLIFSSSGGRVSSEITTISAIENNRLFLSSSYALIFKGVLECSLDDLFEQVNGKTKTENTSGEV